VISAELNAAEPPSAMDMTEAFRYFGALALVLALVGVAGLAIKRFGIPGMAGPGRRMSMVDSLMIGRNHRICIVRCDGVEHVIVSAPQGATLISSAPAKPISPGASSS
jgi:flagellar biogenesis protein FliO